MYTDCVRVRLLPFIFGTMASILSLITAHAESSVTPATVENLLRILHQTVDANYILGAIEQNRGRFDPTTQKADEGAFTQYFGVDDFDFIAAVEQAPVAPGLHPYRFKNELLWWEVLESPVKTVRLIYPRLLFQGTWGKFCLWTSSGALLHDENQQFRCPSSREEALSMQAKKTEDGAATWVSTELEQGLVLASTTVATPAPASPTIGSQKQITLIVSFTFLFLLGIVAGLFLRRKKIPTPPAPQEVKSTRVEKATPIAIEEKNFKSPEGWRVDFVGEGLGPKGQFFWLPYFKDVIVIFFPELRASEQELLKNLFRKYSGAFSMLHAILAISKREEFKLKILSPLLAPLLADTYAKKVVYLRLKLSDQSIDYFGAMKYIPHKPSLGPSQIVHSPQVNPDSMVEWMCRLGDSEEIRLSELGFRIRSVAGAIENNPGFGALAHTEPHPHFKTELELKPESSTEDEQKNGTDNVVMLRGSR